MDVVNFNACEENVKITPSCANLIFNSLSAKIFNTSMNCTTPNIDKSWRKSSSRALKTTFNYKFYSSSKVKKKKKIDKKTKTKELMETQMTRIQGRKSRSRLLRENSLYDSIPNKLHMEKYTVMNFNTIMQKITNVWEDLIINYIKSGAEPGKYPGELTGLFSGQRP